MVSCQCFGEVVFCPRGMLYQGEAEQWVRLIDLGCKKRPRFPRLGCCAEQ